MIWGEQKYNIIYADPPWSFGAWSEKGDGRSPKLHYPCMEYEELAKLPIYDLVDPKRCIMFIWTTYPALMEANRVIEAWGFRYSTVGFTWVKLNRSGKGWMLGLGSTTRANPEICLIARARKEYSKLWQRITGQRFGKTLVPMPKIMSHAVRNLQIHPVREHSRKPDEIRDEILRLFWSFDDKPMPRCIELFARERTPGWHVWGNEVESDIELEGAINNG